MHEIRNERAMKRDHLISLIESPVALFAEASKTTRSLVIPKRLHVRVEKIRDELMRHSSETKCPRCSHSLKKSRY